MKIPARPLIALAVFVVAAIIICFCLRGNERKCSLTPALMTFNGATFETYPLEVTEDKHEIHGSFKANVDFEKVSSTAVHPVYRVENLFDMSTLASPGATISSINELCQQDKPAKEMNSCGDLS
ncbi:hypothetical protein CHS0354_026856 [Potamilus streckersoni]|uniref:Uncharacterized protein n=1 Tax=Potamilus streckersoni TaxID=2493646 RepID=A0AAE0VZ90_9BIVA|nr:hypothetical protein CHS0354_026856 [Potamilus streckersoni]